MTSAARVGASLAHAARSCSPRAAADAAGAGWLAVALVHAVMAGRAGAALDLPQRALRHAYDFGQLLGCAGATWLLVAVAWRLPLAARAAAALAAFCLAELALLDADLESFTTRHAGEGTPWHAAFSLLGALGLWACFAGGLGLAHAGDKGRNASVALGVALAAANHLAVPLDYPGAHFTLAWAASGLIGMSLWRLAAAREVPRPARATAIVLLALCLLSYATVPGPVVRTALLATPGAVTAPFVAGAWAAWGPAGAASLDTHDPAWFTPRRGRPALPPERMPSAPKAPLVILITIDALRADVVDERTAHRKDVPSLLAMSERALRFEHVWSPASYTMASLRSLFMGTYYSQQPGSGASKLRRMLGQKASVPSGPYLPALLERASVRSVSIPTHRVLARDKGICHGFGEEHDVGHLAPAADAIDALLEQLSAEPDLPAFLYAHAMDPHAPYDRGGKRGSPKRRYLAEVALVDAQIGRLRRELRARGLERRSYLIVTADHGEAFGEHGHDFHATTVYDEMIRVPLLIEGPGVAARRVKHPISLLDVAPTVLSLFGAETPGHFMGQSLVPFMRGEDPVLSRPLAVDGSRGIRAMLFEGRWKAIVDTLRGTEELYDLRQDPGERTNLAERPDAARRFATLHAFFAGLSPKDD